MAGNSNVTNQTNQSETAPFLELQHQHSTLNPDSREHDNQKTIATETIEVIVAPEDNTSMPEVQNGALDRVSKNNSTETNEQNDDDPEHKKTKPDVKYKKKPHVRSAFKEYMTTLSHISVFSFTTLIVYLCLTNEFKFFTWHPLLLSLGWAFGMTESILTLSRDNVLYSGHSHQFQKKVHWIILIPSGIFILIGFIIVIINKNNHDPPKEHFTSWHSIFGLIGVMCSVPPYINGTLLWFKKELEGYVDGKLVKLIHIASGVLAFVFGSISVFLSVYTKWFGRNTNHMDGVFYFGLGTAIFPVVWATVKPTMMCYRMVKARMES